MAVVVARSESVRSSARGTNATYSFLPVLPPAATCGRGVKTKTSKEACLQRDTETTNNIPTREKHTHRRRRSGTGRTAELPRAPAKAERDAEEAQHNRRGAVTVGPDHGRVNGPAAPVHANSRCLSHRHTRGNVLFRSYASISDASAVAVVMICECSASSCRNKSDSTHARTHAHARTHTQPTHTPQTRTEIRQHRTHVRGIPNTSPHARFQVVARGDEVGETCDVGAHTHSSPHVPR